MALPSGPGMAAKIARS